MIGRGRPRRLGRRQKIQLALILVILGTSLLVGLGLWVASLRDTDQGDPTKGLTAAFRGEPLDAPAMKFTEVAATSGVVMRHGPGRRARTLPEDTGSGLAWSDVDGDGDFDLYVVNYPGPLGEAAAPTNERDSNRLFINDGGRFVDVTSEVGVADAAGYGMGATFADYDGDGDEDLYVTNMGTNRLFRNRGTGVFDDVTEAAGVGDTRWSTGATWGDYDRDGDLDLYVCNYVKYDAEEMEGGVTVGRSDGAYQVPYTLNPNAFDPQPNSLYRNNGDGTFEEVAYEAGVHNPAGRSLAASFCDLDGDGWLDLYVNNDVSANRLYVNRGAASGTKRFTEIGVTTGTADPRGSMGLSIAEMGALSDVEDGLPDLFISHWVAQENALYLSLKRPGGKLEYRDKTRRVRLGEISLDTVGWGCALVDFDRDGRLDLAVANGSTLEDKSDSNRLVAEPIFLLWNAGTRFGDIAAAAGVTGRHNARGLAAADYDGDGDIDLAVAVNRGSPLLLRNDTETTNRGLALRLLGTPSLAHGARVEVEVEADGRTQTRWWAADVSFCSRHAPEMIFGLGAAKTATVRVTWTDGRITTLEEVPSGSLTVRHEH